MIKKILLSSILTLTICFIAAGSAFAADFPILTKQVEIRQAHLEWKSAGQEIGMETIIAYINEISENAGAAQLSSLLDGFKNQSQTMQTLTTHVAFNNAFKQLRKITTDFRLETRKQMKEHKGKASALISKIKIALEEKQSELDGLKDAFLAVGKNNSLEIFDIRVNHAQEVLNALSANGYDITAAQAKLDEIKNKRSSLESALDEQDNTKIRQVHLEILNFSKELRQIVRDLQVEVPKNKMIKHWTHVGDRVVERTNTIISELETLGIDTTTLRGIHSQAEVDLEKARNEFDAGNFEEAINALKDLKTDLIELRDAYEVLVSGDVLPKNMENKIEATINALDNTVGKMENSIGE